IAFAAVSLVGFLQDFGVNRYVTGERELTPEKLRTAFTVSILFAWSIALVALLLAAPIAWFYTNPRLLPLTLVVAASYLLVPLAIVPQALRQRALDYRSNTMIEVGAALANALVALILAWRGHGALALAWGAFAQQGARLALSQWRAGLVLPWPWRLRGSRPVLEIGAANSALAVANSIIARSPELVVGRLLGETATGLFARAAGLALQLRLLVAGAVTGVFYPAFREVRDRGDPLGPPYLRVAAAYTAVTWAAMGGIAVLAEPLVRLLYGARWAGAAPLLVWIALAQACYVALPLAGDLPLLLGRKRELVRRSALDAAVSLALLALAAPFGLTWVAASRLAHGLAGIAIYRGMMRAMLGYAARDLAAIHARSLAAALAAVAPALVLYAVWDGPAEAGASQLVLAAIGGALAWLVTLRACRHPVFAEIVALARQLRPHEALREAS
ncbi:MAG TPA: oligosaccharide flippase family protein, partial [Novosphingobium sp.]|nr:oligosaccharide flippase family protein [Novosphingobium sp.]